MKVRKIKEKIKALNAKQKKKFKAALIMSLSCIALLSGATYAWFTISNTAKVNNLEITVVSEGKLKIDEKASVLTTGSAEYTLSLSGEKLYPCTTTNDGKTMKKPVYTSNDTVSGTQDINDNEKNKFYYEEVIWLGIVEAGDVNNEYAITLAKKNGSLGSYFNQKNGTTSHPDYCVRISFTLDNGTTAVYEPNSDAHINGGKTEKVDFATDNSGAGFRNTFKQNVTGQFVSQPGTVYYSGDSSELFSITANTATRVTVRVWFEGTDVDCINDIQDGTIEGMFTFVSHKKTT